MAKVLIPPEQRSGDTGWGRRFLPRRPVGWWALGFLLVTGAFPLYWASLDDLLPSDWMLVTVAAAILVTSFLLVREAVFRRKDPAIVVRVLFAVATFEVGLGVLFGLALLGQALG